jgi:hypothetical protein
MSASLELEMFHFPEEAFYAEMVIAVRIATEQPTLLITFSLNLVAAETHGRT